MLSVSKIGFSTKIVIRRLCRKCHVHEKVAATAEFDHEGNKTDGIR